MHHCPLEPQKRSACPEESGALFVGFNLTFFPQFVVGYLGNARTWRSRPTNCIMGIGTAPGTKAQPGNSTNDCRRHPGDSRAERVRVGACRNESFR